MGKIINIPNTPKQLMKILLDAGYEAYVVGGCVRDLLLGYVPNDWEICTNAILDQMKECFADYHVIETGFECGTLIVIIDHVDYKITTYRTDNEHTNHRYPDSDQFISSLKEHLSQRDFTINAIAADISGKIIDFYKGFSDLKHETIKCIGMPNRRFQEDPLLILRAIRFVSEFGFVVGSRTEQAIFKYKILLKQVPTERISKELGEILLGKYCIFALAFWHRILEVLIPEIAPTVGFYQHNYYCHDDVWNSTVMAIRNSVPDLYVRIALLYHDLGKPQCFSMKNGIGYFYGHAAVSKDIAEKSLRNLQFDNQTIKIVTQLIELHDRIIIPSKPVIRNYLDKLGEEQFYRLLNMKEAEYSAQLNIDGDRLHKAEILQITKEILADREAEK